MAQTGFWDDQQKAQVVIAENKNLKNWVDDWAAINSGTSDTLELIELAEMEEDQETLVDLLGDVNIAEKALGELEFRSMLSGPDDSKSAILTIHPGAGGTESADWAEMLLRMYSRWIESKGFASQTLDLQPGEEAGIRSVSVEITGDYAYGYLKAERGVHRLLRISPFDAQSRRHTSFASVFVYPEIDDSDDLDMDEKDVKVDTFRSSGAGGQHVNKTDSAVRMTHVPTDVVAQCQSERSQHKNRANCWKILTARLYEHYREIEEQKKSALENTKTAIEWGNQIRSYVFQPYQMVKDHRTDLETGSVQAVMDGAIDQFIEAYLSMS